jgi:DNA-binding transcriptional LysR family regulator
MARIVCSPVGCDLFQSALCYRPRPSEKGRKHVNLSRRYLSSIQLWVVPYSKVAGPHYALPGVRAWAIAKSADDVHRQGTIMKNADQLSLRQLSCFIAVAEELHFRRAAEKLHMSQPTLTQRIQDMKRDLGVELFRHSGHKIELTDAGRMVLKEAKETLAHAEGVCEAARRAARGEHGRIRVGLTIPVLFFRSIQEAMRAFQEDYPDVSLDLAQISSGPALQALRQRKLDMCLMRRFPVPLPPDCEGIEIERDRLMLVLPAGHPQLHTRRIPLSAVVDEKFISLACKSLREQITKLWEKSGLEPRISQEAQNGPAVMALVAAGLGYAILPSSLQAIRFDHVVWRAIEIEDGVTESSLNLVYHKGTLAERVPSGFIECLRRNSCAANVVRQFG